MKIKRNWINEASEDINKYIYLINNGNKSDEAYKKVFGSDNYSPIPIHYFNESEKEFNEKLKHG